jgi:RNA polymerase sigma-70 factor (ECF subfamily)
VLYERHFDGLYGYLYVRAGRDASRTEELVQDCWMTAVRRIRAFDPARGPFHGWLRGIADRLLLNQRRRWARRQRIAADRPAEPEPAAAAGSDGAERVALALTDLPEHYRAVLQAKYVDQRPVAEIAAASGQTLKAVESLLTRARAALREACARLDEQNK